VSDVLIGRRGRACRITLNRPAALNALTPAMVGPIQAALDGARADPAVALVIIDAVGERAFCAGGDIVALFRTGRTDPELGRAFWRNEYRLNAAIAGFPKPVVTLMDGMAMGGGVGLGCHASHRVVTERSVVAMPEATIGFSPDVGGTRLLARAPGRCGEYLAATADRMDAADAIDAGFADWLVPSSRLRALVAALEASGDPGAIAEAAAAPPPSSLKENQASIDALFAEPDPARLCANLKGSPFAEAAAALIARNAPFSVACAIASVRMARADPAIESCLAREYRFSFRTLERDDFYEGVRAALIDKDRNPRWNPETMAAVDPSAVAAIFAPLGAHEWRP
jgi:enoyl-CoA hydratase